MNQEARGSRLWPLLFWLERGREINPDCVQNLVNPPTGKRESEAADRKAEGEVVSLTVCEAFLSKIQQQNVELALTRVFLGNDSGMLPTQVFLVSRRWLICWEMERPKS